VSEVEQPDGVLVRLPTWVGDVVMATPALRALRCGLPDAHIIVEGRGFLSGLLAGLDSFDEFVTAPGRGLGELWRHGRQLAQRRLALALLLPDAARAAVPTWIARVPRRVGYSRDPARRLLLTDALSPPRNPDGSRRPIPMVERYLAITRRVDCDLADPRVELAVDEATRHSVRGRLATQQHESGKNYAVVTPGASFGASKLYPPESFARACDGLIVECDLSIVFAPGPGEEQLCRHVVELMHHDALVLADPVTTLAEHKALLADAALAVSNDTGPRHMAVALGVPTVTLMGPTDPRHTEYQLDRQRVLREDVECSPCHEKICPIDHRCMTRLAPERIVAAAADLLGRRKEAPAA
jgi:heptosyltransferase-2